MDRNSLLFKFEPLLKDPSLAGEAATIAEEYHKAQLKKKIQPVEIDGYKVIEEYLLYKGEEMVDSDMKIQFKPLVDFGLIFYHMKVTTTTRLAMKFDLEKFFMRKCAGIISGNETKFVKVPQDTYDRVKAVNDQFRSTSNE